MYKHAVIRISAMADPVTFKIDFDNRPGVERFEYDVKTHKLKINDIAVKSHPLYEGGPIVYQVGRKSVTIAADGSKATLSIGTPICQ